MTTQSVTALALASPAFALDAFQAQRAGSIEAILAGQAAKLGGATTVDGMKAATVKKGLKELDAPQDIIDHMTAKLEKDSSCYVKRGRVWLHVLFVEPDAADTVEGYTVAVREEIGKAMACAKGCYDHDGYAVPKTVEDAHAAAVERLGGVVEVAREKGKTLAPNTIALAKNLGVSVAKVKKAKAKDAASKGNQMRLTLNALAENVATKSNAPVSWVEAALTKGTALVLNFKTQSEREAFEEALTKAQAK